MAAIKPPERSEPDREDWRYPLWQRVKQALLALPGYFATETYIAGLRATDIFTLNQTLGAAIEDQVVETLNRMRPVWDPENKHPLLYFVRQPQTFPDVLLRSRSETGAEITFGIELKGWYLLAKEGEPSFRYQVTASACSDWDLLAVVPWFLSNVISGKPRVLTPFIESAKYATVYRNYHWQDVRTAVGNAAIKSPTGISPYPKKSDRIADRPAEDAGGNFGRLARTGLMESYAEDVNNEPIAGIAASYWRRFFKVFQERADPAGIAAALEKIGASAKGDELTVERARQLLAQVVDFLKREQDE